MPDNLQGISHRLSNITERLKGTDINENLSLRVVGMVLELQKIHLQQKAKLSPERRKRMAPANIRSQVCQLLHISPRIYGRIIHKYLSETEMYVSGKQQAGRSSNTDSKNTRIPRALQIAVRTWVREKRSRKERVTARQVLDYFVEHRHLLVPFIPDDNEGAPLFDPIALKVALRNVQRWITWAGYSRGPRHNIRPNPINILKRHQFLREFFANRALPEGERKREVYLDESYIHEHYNRNDDSIWDPNDEQDIQIGKNKHKG